MLRRAILSLSHTHRTNTRWHVARHGATTVANPRCCRECGAAILAQRGTREFCNASCAAIGRLIKHGFVIVKIQSRQRPWNSEFGSSRRSLKYKISDAGLNYLRCSEGEC